MKKTFLSIVVLINLLSINLLQSQVSTTNCSVTGSNGSAIGYYSEAVGNYSLAAGSYVKSWANNSYVFGTGISSGKIGYFLTNDVPNSFLIGFDNTPVFFAQLYSNVDFPINDGTPEITEPRVGIGTIAPKARLDVRGTTRLESLRLVDNVQYMGGSVSFRPLDNEDYYGPVEYSAATLTLKGDRVGVKVDNPTATLDVAGRIKAHSLQVDTLLTSWEVLDNIEYQPNMSFVAVTNVWDSIGEPGIVAGGQSSVIKNKVMTLTNGGVGIRTEDPVYPLQVKGDGLFERGQLRINGRWSQIDNKIIADLQLGDKWLFQMGASNNIGSNWKIDTDNIQINTRPHRGAASSIIFSSTGDIHLRSIPETNGTGSIASWNNLTLKGDGKVGIGTEAPSEQMQIGNIWTFHNGGTKYIGRNVKYTQSGNTRIEEGYSSLFAFHENGSISLQTGGTGGQNSTVNTEGKNLILTASGNVGIGTADPQYKLHVTGSGYLAGSLNIGGLSTDNSYKLAVNGHIGCKEVVVEVESFYVPDYVFEPDYDLMNLEDVESYILEHKHLPEIPSAGEIGETGLSLSEMNLLLLKKVEELTLYIIEQNKRIETLEKTINN